MPKQPFDHTEPPPDHPAVHEVRRHQAKLEMLKTEAQNIRAERDDALAQLIREGYTPGKTARAVGMSTQTVRNIKIALQAEKKNRAEN